MMKKVLSVLLILTFVLAMASLAACGDKKSDDATEAPAERKPDGETYELKDQDGAYTFSLQSYKDASLSCKIAPYADRDALEVASDKGEYKVYVYINNGYRNNYESKHESGKEDGGVDITVGEYKGYTYPKTVLNAAFIDTGAKVEDESDIITMVVEQPQPFTHDINEVIADQELTDLLATLTLTKSPV